MLSAQFDLRVNPALMFVYAGKQMELIDRMKPVTMLTVVVRSSR